MSRLVKRRFMSSIGLIKKLTVVTCCLCQVIQKFLYEWYQTFSLSLTVKITLAFGFLM